MCMLEDKSKMYEEMFSNSEFQMMGSRSTSGLGEMYEMPESVGGGYFWVYSLADQYSIKIHNFYFNEDVVADFPGHDGLSVCYYYSISGEELDPYKRMHAGEVRFLNYADYHFKALIHKNIPIQTVEIEFYESYYSKFISEKFGSLDIDFNRLFRNIDWCTDFPEMEALLHQIWNYRGEGIAAKLFYDSMVSQAVSLIVDYNSRKQNPEPELHITDEDRHSIMIVNKYLDDHFAGNISTEQLCKIACFGRTKFKTLFKQINKCTVTEYVTDRRLSQAESLLTQTDLTVEQIAQSVGYSNASRFAALFRKSTGIFPSDFRKMARRGRF